MRLIWILISLLTFISFILSSSTVLFLKSSPSSQPRVHGYCSVKAPYQEPIIINHFITSEEAKHIITTATPQLQTSRVVHDPSKKENGVNLKVRSSRSTFLSKENDPIVRRIVRRACKKVHIPFNQAEDLQVVHYKKAQEYRPHHDACCDGTTACKKFCKRGGNRICTVLIYLTDDFLDGETVFPNLDNRKIKPSRYSAIVFYPTDKDRTCCHPKALHGGVPIREGEKWICNIWFREDRFR